MAKRKETQAQILERVRGERDLNKTEMCAALAISRPTYDAWLGGAEMTVKHLSILAVDHVGEWIGDLAVELITLIDPRLVPCTCQTAIGDAGPCPKPFHKVRVHGVVVAELAEGVMA